MKKRYILLVSSWLILLLTACVKQEIKQMVKPFENIPISSVLNVKL